MEPFYIAFIRVKIFKETCYHIVVVIYISVAAPKLPSVALLTFHDLPGVSDPGFGCGNDVLVGIGHNDLVKFSLTGNYTKVWEKSMGELEYNHYKFILGSGDIIIPCVCRHTTFIFSSEFHLKSTYDVRSHSLCLLCISTDRLIYGNRHDGQYVLDVFTMQHKLLHRLAPPNGRWTGALSVCVVPGTGHIVVASNHNKWLDIFTMTGALIYVSIIYYLRYN